MANSFDLKPYLDVASHSKISWMDESELGMAPRRIKSKYPVLLWPYKAKNFLELISFFTHEVVHYVHPEFDSNEGAVEALTIKLMRSVRWVAYASVKVGAGLHNSVLRLFKKKQVSIDV